MPYQLAPRKGTPKQTCSCKLVDDRKEVGELCWKSGREKQFIRGLTLPDELTNVSDEYTGYAKRRQKRNEGQRLNPSLANEGPTTDQKVRGSYLPQILKSVEYPQGKDRRRVAYRQSKTDETTGSARRRKVAILLIAEGWS